MKITSLPIQVNRPVNSIDVSIAVLSKNLDTIEQLGQSMINMMEKSLEPHMGQNIDIQI